MKIATVVGTRPEIIRLSRTIAVLDRHVNHVLIHTGQNYDYELNEVFFSQLGIRLPNEYLNAAGGTAAETIGQIIIAADRVFRREMPDAVLILGDTNSALAALAAKRLKIPVFHMEAGNRCFDFGVPEEINRRIVDHIADINLTYSEIARAYLLREGIPPDQVICTGSPMKEVLDFYRPEIDASTVLSDLGLQKQRYFVVSSHREENIDSDTNLHGLFEVLDALAERYGDPIIVSTHPRTAKKIQAKGLNANSMVRFCKPFGFPDYVHLQYHARATLSDSGTVTEESSILNFPALNLRDVHERPEGFEEAAVMFVGMNKRKVLSALEILERQARGSDRMLRMVRDYDVPNVSEKVLRIIVSYTDFVNRRTWGKRV